jgi:hypothetical protein
MHRSSKFLLCVNNADYRASLEARKVYVRLRDPRAEEHGLVRVVDESGEDYLYPEALFVPIEVPRKGKLAFPAAR